MAGTNHFSRIHYNFMRGLREIVAPRQKLNDEDWKVLLDRFDGRCAFCNEPATKENRGIVADHLVAAAQFGELVLGNVVPSCQTCNDSRGNQDWREFISERFPEDAAYRIQRIQECLDEHPYSPVTLDAALNDDERIKYKEIEREWDALLRRAKALREQVNTRRERD